MNLIIKKPAQEWVQGLPIGNGISAAMIWGLPACATLSLNHVDFWRDNLKTDIGEYANIIREVKELILKGEVREANELYQKKVNMKIMPRDNHVCHEYAGYTNSFQPIGDITINYDGLGGSSDYVRQLDLETGIAVVKYKSGSSLITEQYFVSAEYDLIIVKISSDTAISGVVHFTRPKQDGYSWLCTAQNDELRMNGIFDDNVRASLLIRTKTDGIVKGREDGSLKFIEAHDLELVISLEAGKGNEDFAERCRKKISAINDERYEQILAKHCEEHRRMFNRARLVLGGDPAEYEDTASLILRAGQDQYSGRLAELVFGMGRYLSMSCNRAGRRPANLQGIWNNQTEPMWDCDWHFDMNIEMNNWLNNPTNLDECNLALFKQCENFLEYGKTIARKITGCEGILFYTIAGGDGMMWTSQGSMWTGAAGWIAQHFWTHYEFTRDEEFLRDRAYPFLKQVGLFYKDFVVKNKQGKYVTGISHSPENVPPNGDVMNEHCTMDTALIREVMRNLLEAGKILNCDRDLWPTWQDIHDNVLEYPISDSGELKEWPMPLDENPNHRHFSHLYPLFPGDEIRSDSTPKLFDAARKAVYLREKGGYSHNFGWSYSYLACFHARLGEGEMALKNLNLLAQSVTLDNLLTLGTDWRDRGLTVNWKFNTPKLFQIEAALGATAAIAEMLLQSHADLIRLLPALPSDWSCGSFQGLKARGAFVLDIDWENHRVKRVKINSLKGCLCKIICCTDWNVVQLSSDDMAEQKAKPDSGEIIFATKINQIYTLQFS